MRRRLPAPPLALLLALGLPACGGGGGGSAGAPAAASPTPGAADIALLDLGGIRDLLGSLRGKVAVVNVWASWCVPCAAEFTELDVFARDYRDRDVVVVAVSVDDPMLRHTAVASFVTARRPGFRVVLKDRGDDAPFRSLLDPRWDGSIPSTFVLDRQGRLHASLVGPRKREELEQAVAPLVGSPRPRG
jgi:thiol-disulfide isomerase/thioredoxin